MQAPVGGVTHDLGQRGNRCGIRVAGGCCVVEQTQQWRITDAVHTHLARAVLRWVARVSRFQSAGRPRDRAKRGLHQRQRRSAVKLARNHQHRVVGLVIPAVKGLQIFNAHVLHIGARANRGFAVVVPIESRCCHALPEHPAGAVLARLHLVAHHAELGLQIALRNAAIDHAVGFHLQGPAQVVIAGAEALKVVGAVVGGSAVKAHATSVELLHDVAARGRALEHQVLQQMRHAGLAIVLVAATHAVGHIDRGGGLGPIGREQHPQTIGQAVFADAFDLGEKLRATYGSRRRRGLRLGQYANCHKKTGTKTCRQSFTHHTFLHLK